METMDNQTPPSETAFNPLDVFKHLPDYRKPNSDQMALHLTAKSISYVYEKVVFHNYYDMPDGLRKIFEDVNFNVNDVIDKIEIYSHGKMTESENSNIIPLNAVNDSATDNLSLHLTYKNNVTFSTTSIPTNLVNILADWAQKEMTYIDTIIKKLMNIKPTIKSCHANPEHVANIIKDTDKDKKENSCTTLRNRIFGSDSSRVKEVREKYDCYLVEHVGITISGKLSKDDDRNEYIAYIMLADLIHEMKMYKSRLSSLKSKDALWIRSNIRTDYNYDEKIDEFVFNILPHRAFTFKKHHKKYYLATSFVLYRVKGHKDLWYIHFDSNLKYGIDDPFKIVNLERNFDLFERTVKKIYRDKIKDSVANTFTIKI